jgi:pimeloyl-ACP methyl ester carboxylesterase
MIELPGFGNSDALSDTEATGSTLDDIGQLILNECGRQHIRKPWIVGHSLGGYVALAMAAAAPDDFAGLVLFHSSPFADSPERRNVRDQVIASVKEYGPRPFLQSFADGLFKEKGLAWKYFNDHTQAVTGDSIAFYARLMRDRPDRSELLRTGRIPIGVVAGRFDRLMPMEVMQQSAALHPSVKIMELLGSAHVGMLEEPAESAEILKSFIRREDQV